MSKYFRYKLHNYLKKSTSLLNVNQQDTRVDIGNTINQKPVIDNEIQVEVVAVITNVSSDFIVDIVLYSSEVSSDF